MRRIWLFTVCSAMLGAHEIGTTRVAATFHPDHTYEIKVETDAGALADKLLAVTGSQVPTSRGASDVQRLLYGFDSTFRQRVRVLFDGRQVQPAAATYSIVPANGPASVPGATVLLSGQIPPGSRQFSWAYGWTFASYALTIRNSTGSGITEWLEGDQTSSPFTLMLPAPREPRLMVAGRYLALGFTHIVPLGLDHMLFVLGIYLLSRQARSVLWQVSAFTVAHSITLGLSMYGLVSVPSRIVEAAIAISIAYVAIENIFLAELKSWRIALVFAFGLLHGLGFAGALKAVGLPRAEFLTALLTFNVGVEAGQLAVILTAFLLFGWHYSRRDWYRRRIVVPLSMVIACTAVYWTIQRLS